MPCTISESTEDTRLLFAAIERAVSTEWEDRLIPYEYFNNAIGKDVQRVAYHSMYTARKQAVRELREVLQAVKGVGFRIATDEEKAVLWRPELAAVGRKVRRTAKKMFTVHDFNSLPYQKKVDHHVGISVMASMAQIAKPSSVANVEAKITIVGNRLSPGEIFSACSKSHKWIEELAERTEQEQTEV